VIQTGGIKEVVKDGSWEHIPLHTPSLRDTPLKRGIKAGRGLKGRCPILSILG